MAETLTITSDDAATLAHELAALRHQSLEDAVTGALRASLAAERLKAARVARALELAAEIRAGLTRPLPSPSQDDLYDEKGLPR